MSLVGGPFKKSEYGKKHLIFMKRQYWWNWWGIRAYSARRRGGWSKMGKRVVDSIESTTIWFLWFYKEYVMYFIV